MSYSTQNKTPSTTIVTTCDNEHGFTTMQNISEEEPFKDHMIYGSMYVGFSKWQSSSVVSFDVIFFDEILRPTRDPRRCAERLMAFAHFHSKQCEYPAVLFRPLWWQHPVLDLAEKGAALSEADDAFGDIGDPYACPQFAYMMDILTEGIKPEADTATTAMCIGVAGLGAIVVYQAALYVGISSRSVSRPSTSIVDSIVQQVFDTFTDSIKRSLTDSVRDLGLTSWPRLIADLVAAVMVITGSVAPSERVLAGQIYALLHLPSFSTLTTTQHVYLGAVMFALWKSCGSGHNIKPETDAPSSVDVQTNVADALLLANPKWAQDFKQVSKWCKEAATVVSMLILVQKLISMGESFYSWMTGALSARDDIVARMHEYTAKLEQGAPIDTVLYKKMKVLDKERRSVCIAHMNSSFNNIAPRFDTALHRASIPAIFGEYDQPFNVFLGGDAGTGKSCLAMEIFRMMATHRKVPFNGDTFDVCESVNGGNKYPGDVYTGQKFLLMNENAYDLEDVTRRAEFLNFLITRCPMESSCVHMKAAVYADFYSVVVTNNHAYGSGFNGLDPKIKQAITRRFAVSAMMTFKDGHTTPKPDYSHAVYTLLDTFGAPTKSILGHDEFIMLVYESLLDHDKEISRAKTRVASNADLKSNPALRCVADRLCPDLALLREEDAPLASSDDSSSSDRDTSSTSSDDESVVVPEGGIIRYTPIGQTGVRNWCAQMCADGAATARLMWVTDKWGVFRKLLAITAMAIGGVYAAYRLSRSDLPITLDQAVEQAGTSIVPEVYNARGSARVARVRAIGLNSRGVATSVVSESGYVDAPPLPVDLLRTIRDNMVEIYAKGDGDEGSWKTNGVMLGGRRLMTVAHFFDGLPETGVVTYVVRGCSKCTHDISLLREVDKVRIGGVDLISFDVPSQAMPTYPKIISRVDQAGFVPTVPTCGYLINNNICDPVYAYSLQSSLADTASAGLQYSVTNGEVHTLDAGFAYEYTRSGPGFCGTLLVVGGVIVGMHVAGNKSERGYAVGLTRGDVAYMLSTVPSKNGAVMPNPTDVLRELIPDAIVGVVPGCALPVVNKEFEQIKYGVETNLPGRYNAACKVPCALNWDTHEDGTVSHKMLTDIVLAADKSTRTLSSLGGDSDLLNRAVSSVASWHLNMVRENLSQTNDGRYTIYDLSTAITGKHGLESVMLPLNLDKSHGFSSKGPSCVKRSQVVSVDSEGVVTLNREFEDHLNGMLSIMKRTGSIAGLNVLDITAKVSPKVELVSNPTKLRSFYGSPACMLYIARMYLGCLLGVWKRDPVGTGTGAGISPFSVHWDEIYHHYTSRCTRVLSGDVKKWDKCILRDIRAVVPELLTNIARSFELSDDDTNVMRALGEYYSGAHVVALAGLLVRLDNLWPSGLVGTTQFGSLFHQVIQVYGLCKMTKRTKPSEVAAIVNDQREAKSVFYSDDSLLPLTALIRDDWDLSVYLKSVGELGIEMSSPVDKTQPPEVVPITQASFIARQFAPDKTNDKRVLCPLDYTSLLSCTVYKHKGPSDMEHAKALLPALYTEMLMYGEDAFESNVSNLRDYANKFPILNPFPLYNWKQGVARLRDGEHMPHLCGEMDYMVKVPRKFVLGSGETGRILAHPQEVGQVLVPPPTVVAAKQTLGGALGGIVEGTFGAAGHLLGKATTSFLSSVGLSKPFTPILATIGAIGAVNPNGANATGEYTGTILSICPQSLDPSGVVSETSGDTLGSRRVIMRQSVWSASAPSGTILINDMPITPLYSNSVINGVDHRLSLHPGAALVASCNYWSYDFVTITVTFTSPALMSGSVIGAFSGSASLAGVDVMTSSGSFTPTGMMYMDISATNEFSITLPWTSVYPCLRGCIVDQSVTFAGGIRAFPLAMSLTVQQPLRNTVSAGVGLVDVYVSLEFKGLRGYSRSSAVLEALTITPESGVVGDNAGTTHTPTQVIPGTIPAVVVPGRYPRGAMEMRPRGALVDPVRISRYTLLANYTIGATPGLVGFVSLPGDLLKSPPIQHLTSYMTLLSTKLRVLIQIRSTASQQGLLIASVIPSGLMAGSSLAAYTSDVTRATTFQHARMLLGGAREAEISMDWGGLLPHYQLGGATQVLLGQERSMVGYVLALTLPTPVTNAMGGDAVATVSVYAMFEDAELAIPNTFTVVAPQSGTPVNNMGAGLEPDQDTGGERGADMPTALMEVPYKGLFFGGDNVTDVLLLAKASHYTACNFQNVSFGTGQHVSVGVVTKVPWVFRPPPSSAAIWSFIRSWFSYSRGSMAFTMLYPSSGFATGSGKLPYDTLMGAYLVNLNYDLFAPPEIESTTTLYSDTDLSNTNVDIKGLEYGGVHVNPKLTKHVSVVVPYVFPTAWVYMPPDTAAITPGGHYFPAIYPSVDFAVREYFTLPGNNTWVKRGGILGFHGCDDYELSALRPAIGYSMTTANMQNGVLRASLALYK